MASHRFLVTISECGCRLEKRPSKVYLVPEFQPYRFLRPCTIMVKYLCNSGLRAGSVDLAENRWGAQDHTVDSQFGGWIRQSGSGKGNVEKQSLAIGRSRTRRSKFETDVKPYRKEVDEGTKWKFRGAGVCHGTKGRLMVRRIQLPSAPY
jgi:hypothetical protein